MEIPLQNRLKKKAHVELASLQDEAVEIIYSLFPKIVFHGGTCIWRCYGGNRFSEDLDFYLAGENFEEGSLRQALEGRGLSLVKFKKTANLIFAKISSPEAQIRLEINLSTKKEGLLRPYEKAGGAVMEVLCLPAEELLMEQLSAYENRRLVRDLYDVCHLSRIANVHEKEAGKIKKFLQNPPKPIDEKNLKAIVYMGAVPTYEQMLEMLRGRFA